MIELPPVIELVEIPAPARHFSGDYPTPRPQAALGVSFTSPTKNAGSGTSVIELVEIPAVQQMRLPGSPTRKSCTIGFEISRRLAFPAEIAR